MTPPRFNDKVVLRSGYGLYFTRPPVNDAFQLIVNPPFFSRQTNIGVLNALATLQNPFNPPSNEVFPNFVARSATSALTINSINPDWHPPRTQQWNFGIQYALNSSTTVQIGYVGTHSDRIETTNSINQALLASPTSPVNGITTNTVANAVDRVPVLGIAPSGLNQARWVGISNYNSLQTGWQYRTGRGLTLTTAYTWGHVLTDVADRGFDGRNTGAGAQNPRDFKAEYGSPGWDRTHIFTAGYIYELPFLRNRHDILGQAFGNWVFSGITVIESGFALGAQKEHAHRAMLVQNRQQGE